VGHEDASKRVYKPAVQSDFMSHLCITACQWGGIPPRCYDRAWNALYSFFAQTIVKRRCPVVLISVIFYSCFFGTLLYGSMEYRCNTLINNC